MVSRPACSAWRPGLSLSGRTTDTCAKVKVSGAMQLTSVALCFALLVNERW